MTVEVLKATYTQLVAWRQVSEQNVKQQAVGWEISFFIKCLAETRGPYHSG